jgi:hypothetical protein
MYLVHLEHPPSGPEAHCFGNRQSGPQVDHFPSGEWITFRAARPRGFALDDQEAFRVLSEWNARCVPPWSERELVAKIAHARKYGREPTGHLHGSVGQAKRTPITS